MKPIYFPWHIPCSFQNRELLNVVLALKKLIPGYIMTQSVI